MKKLFYLLFISSVLASCTKDEPVECLCGSSNGTGTNSSSFNCDASLVGLWMGTATGSTTECLFYISESGNGYYDRIGGGDFTGYYSCTDGFLSFLELGDGGYCFSGTYSISGNTMIYEVITSSSSTNTYTLTKQ